MNPGKIPTTAQIFKVKMDVAQGADPPECLEVLAFPRAENDSVKCFNQECYIFSQSF